MTKSELFFNQFVTQYHINEFTQKSDLEVALCDYLHKYHKIKLERASYEGRMYPELLILDRTRNIFGYLSIQQLNDNLSNPDALKDIDSLTRKRIQICYSEIDRPVFFVYFNSSTEGRGIYFMTSEQVQDILTTDDNMNNQTLFYPQQDLMGDFSEMITIIKSNL